MARPDELTFAPLGGVGEIGMNLSIYGLGNRHQRALLAVDLGVFFGVNRPIHRLRRRRLTPEVVGALQSALTMNRETVQL